MGRLQKHYQLVVFLLAAHLLYAPAWEAGLVRDVSGWLQTLHHQSFPDYLMRRGLQVESLYPVTQGMLWVWWKLFGIHPLPWHLMMVSIHGVCAWGWMRFYRRIFRNDSIGLFAGWFVLVSPYATEVVVWEAGYHYLQGMLLLLAVLWCLFRYFDSGKTIWLGLGVLLFIPSLFALEVFYLTPVSVAVLLVHFRKNPLSPKAVRWLLLPILGLCLAQYLLFRSLYHYQVPHIEAIHPRRVGGYLRKPAKYLFNLFLMGRYWPDTLRQTVYGFLNSAGFLAGFYLIVAAGVFQFRKRFRLLLNQPVWVPLATGLAALLLVTPLYFQDAGQVDFDRYTYFMLPAVGALLGYWIANPTVRILVLVGAAGLLLYTVLGWRRSDALNRKLLLGIPDFKDGRTTVLLNVPNTYNGIPMTGQTTDGEVGLMRRYVFQKPFSGLVTEPCACNIASEQDLVVTTQWQGPQTVRVTQPNGGGWWVGGGANVDWANDWFSVQFIPERSAYDLHLKQPVAQYHLLHWRNDRWIEL
ncbi:MAG: hypothetical protein EOP52_09055 [Sphingobacteriales bacterium]|nr:MAG: hypothetical protein EOP52_09055 [Sphingobacteriales bacterium]